MRIRLTLNALLFTTALAGGATTAHAAPGEAPQISFEETKVIVTVKAGSSIVFFGAAHNGGVGVELRRWRRPATDVNRDGRIVIDLREPVEPHSVWFAIDAETGGTGVAAPETSAFRRIDFPAAVLPRRHDGALDRYITGRSMVDLLVVRPRVGAWVGSAGDGHEGDADGEQNGGITMTFETLQRMRGNAPPPAHLTTRDVVIAVDLLRMQYYLTEVAQ